MIILTHSNRSLEIDGKTIDPGPSQKLCNHSPDGFEWGYLGSGPAQLSLAILLRLAGREFALSNYQRFKEEVISKLMQGSDIQIDTSAVRDWINSKGGKNVRL
jgi:hypothetical protein